MLLLLIWHSDIDRLSNIHLSTHKCSCEVWKFAIAIYCSAVVCCQLLDLPGIIEGAKDGKGRGKQVIAGKPLVQTAF